MFRGDYQCESHLLEGAPGRYQTESRMRDTQVSCLTPGQVDAQVTPLIIVARDTQDVLLLLPGKEGTFSIVAQH